MFFSRLFQSAKSHQTARLSVEVLGDRIAPATLSVGDATVFESFGGTFAEVVVTLSGPTNRTVQVSYKTVNGTALAWSDYAATSGKLTFAPGETSKTILVPVNGDGVAETEETFSVQLSRARNAKIADGQGVVTIVDDGNDDGYVDYYGFGYLPDYGYFGNGGPYEY